jgi:hypothetical protein
MSHRFFGGGDFCDRVLQAVSAYGTMYEDDE